MQNTSCDFVQVGKYLVCKRIECRKKVPVVSNIKSRCKAFPLQQCVHLGDRIGITLIQCETCLGDVKLKYPVNKCAVWGKCLPSYIGEHKVHSCIGCEEKEFSTKS